MRVDADVAVVGAGIAGSAACVALSRCGLRPLWIAPQSGRAGDPVGESLAPAAEPILESLGLSALLETGRHRPANTTFSAWGSSRLVERNAMIHLEGAGRVLDRRAFEAGLASAAGQAADRREAALVQAEPADGAWRLALDDAGALTVRFIVDATGRGAAIGRRLAEYRRADNLVAAAALLPQHDHGVEPTPATVLEATAQGWWYAALLADGRLSVAYFSDPDLLPQGLSRDTAAWRRLLGDTLYVGRWIDDAGFAADHGPRLASAGTTWLEQVCGSPDGAGGWAAIGDAAAAFDPLSSHGITTALWSAARIGEAVPAALKGDGAPLAAYAAAVKAGRERFLVQRKALYACETRFADAPFWSRRRG